MERFEIIATKGNVSRNQVISLLKNLEIDVDYCCDSENISIYTYPEKATRLADYGYNLIRPKISGIYQISDYHDQLRLSKSLQQFQEKYQSICELSTIGKSVKGLDLYMFKISSNNLPGYQKPNFLWVANMHGDEIIGREMSILFIDYLCHEYMSGTDSEIRKRIIYLVDHINIYILPSLNPDGFENLNKHGEWLPNRYNANNVDLNRNFPTTERQTPLKPEPETQAMMDWSKKVHVHLSVSIHSGAIVVNYPYDKGSNGKKNPTSYDEFFMYLSRQIVANNKWFSKSKFPNGITNGSQWYSIIGSMSDWRFDYKKGFELTLELSREKLVYMDEIKRIWEDTKISFIKLIETIPKNLGIFDGIYIKNIKHI